MKRPDLSHAWRSCKGIATTESEERARQRWQGQRRQCWLPCDAVLGWSVSVTLLLVLKASPKLRGWGSDNGGYMAVTWRLHGGYLAVTQLRRWDPARTEDQEAVV